MAKRYICDTNNEILSDWLKNVHEPASKVLEQKKSFLEKQGEAISKEWADHWDNLFDRLKDAGIISQDKSRDDYGMSLSEVDGIQQLFIQKKNDTDLDLSHILKHILIGPPK